MVCASFDRGEVEMKFLLAIAALLALDARADSLFIDGPYTSYYYVGSALVISGQSITMTATNVAIGDDFGEVARSGFDGDEWTWSVDLNGAPMEGSAMCFLVSDAPDAELCCD